MKAHLVRISLRILFCALAIATIAACTLYLYFSRLAPPIIQQLAHVIGAESVTTKGLSLSPTRLGIEEAILRFSGEKEITIQGGELLFSVRELIAQEIKEIHVKELRFSNLKGLIFHNVNLSPLTRVAGKISGTLETEGTFTFAPPQGRQTLPFSLHVESVMENSLLKADFKGTSPLLSQLLQGHIEHDFAAKIGLLQGMDITVTSNELEQLIAFFLEDVPHLDEGTVSATAEFEWDSNSTQPLTKQTLDVKLSKLSGEVKEIAFENLSATAVFQSFSPLVLSTFTAALDHIDLGVPFSAVKARGKVRTSMNNALVVDMQGGSAKLFDGELTLQPFFFEIGKAMSTTTVTLTSLSIEEILKLYGQEKLTGSGHVDGTLPLTITTQGAIITDGSLAARAPGGILECDLSAWLAGHPGNIGIEFASRALKNFHYSSLASTVNYKEDGALTLNIQLQGVNPDLNKGQPVNVNVTVEENIPALIQSLKLIKRGPQGLIEKQKN
jgi:hypothetical protein